jgi:hypothetical protein
MVLDLKLGTFSQARRSGKSAVHPDGLGFSRSLHRNYHNPLLMLETKV